MKWVKFVIGIITFTNCTLICLNFLFMNVTLPLIFSIHSPHQSSLISSPPSDPTVYGYVLLGVTSKVNLFGTIFTLLYDWNFPLGGYPC